jgi:uncharacterized protein (DUF427 family)
MPTPDDPLAQATALWRWTGRDRPPFALLPAPGQESVWDYPRPPRLVADPREVIVTVGGVEVVRTRRALRLLETASPPAFYLPLADADPVAFQPAAGASHCEWKGRARYWTIVAGGLRLERAAWSYDSPPARYAAIVDHVALYPEPAVCTVAGERVRRQEGGFYGGWVTDEIVGPWKGGPGTGGW